MKYTPLYTSLKARLQLVKVNPGVHYNWLFLAGGPGLGSESLTDLTAQLDIPGLIWHLDLPGDGSNLTSDDALHFSRWSQALVEAAKALSNVILVGHSTGGMYIQATAELENIVAGVVLMDSAPDASWQQHFNHYASTHPLPEVERASKVFEANPNNETLKQLTIAAIPYSFTEEGAKKISMENWGFNLTSYLWSAEHFDTIYAATWIPRHIPTLIFGGAEDHIIPLSLFKDAASYQRDNILIRSIENAGHFPWIENPQAVASAFDELVKKLQK